MTYSGERGKVGDRLPIAITKLPARKFPILFEFLHPVTQAIVWSRTVKQPSDFAILRIPPLRHELGHPVSLRITFGDGEVQEELPPDASRLSQ